MEEREEPKKPPREPALISALDLYRTPFPPIDWVIKDFLVAGTLSILAGKPKIGKSFLALQAGLSITRVEDFLGLSVGAGGPVWFLGLEDSERRLNFRITGQLGAGVEPPARLLVACWWPRLGGEMGGLEWIKRRMSETGAPRLIIIDTYARFRALTRGGHSSGNMYETQYDDLVPLIDFCQEAGVAIWLIHHTNKTGASDVFDRISGSVALQGAVDTMMVLDRERGTGERGALLSVTARDFEGFESALEFEKVPGTWKSLGPASAVRLSRDQEALLAILRDLGGEACVADIAERTEPRKTKETTRKALARMQDSKLVEVSGVGRGAVWKIV